jgi:hypothetical protein
MLPSVKEVEQNIRRGLRVKVDNVYFRDYEWQPHLEVVISVESVRQVPVRVSSVDLSLHYMSKEVGPLPPLNRPYEITEPDEAITIRMRKDLYPTLAEELRRASKDRKEGHFQIRGMIIVESPDHAGFMQFPVDLPCVVKL